MSSTERPKRKPARKGVRKGYTHASPAICMVVHDLGGRPMSDKIANEILDAVTEKAVKYGYVINYCRQ